MSELDQAALIVHESFYSVLRDWESETNSIRVRRAVGYVFSGHGFQLIPPELPSKVLECRSTNDPGLEPHVDVVDFYLKPPLSGDTTHPLFGIYPKIIESTGLIGLLSPTNEHNLKWWKGHDLSDILDCSVQSGFGLNFQFDGPAEFDRVLKFWFNCHGKREGQADVYIEESAPGTNSSIRKKLDCQIVKPH
jgi:hypothetical protein